MSYASDALIDALERENAKLREEIEAAKHDLQVFSMSSVQFDAENVKLRELVRDVYALHWSGLDCTECPWIGECDTDGGCPWLGIMHDHMRELGLVDE